jgi:transposase
MSTSLLYHAFALRGYRYVRTHFFEGEVVFAIEARPELFRCAACGSSDVMKRGRVVRCFRAMPIGHKATTLLVPVQRLGCRRCGVVRQAHLGFADPLRSYTRSFERFALELSRRMTIKDVAAQLQVGWDVIKDIQMHDLQRRFARPRLRQLRIIALDEIAVAKGHRYLTLVVDLAMRVVVFVGDGKGADALDPFWTRLRRSRATVQAVAIDLSAAYILAVSCHLAEAVLIFDHFHIVKLFNDKLSVLRRELHHQACTDKDKKVLKGTRWLLLKNPENLDPQKNEKRRLDEALKLNKPLAMAYYLKEDLRQLWSQRNKKTAERFLDSWVARASASEIAILEGFAETLNRHRAGILAYYDYPISTGPLEGINNKIKTLKRQAYGFRDMEFFKLKILALHETRQVLVG